MVRTLKPRRERIAIDRDAILKGVHLRPESVTEALASLEAVSRRLLATGDPRAAFPDIYALITRRVAREVAAARGAFLEPGWISRLAGRFCERYLATLGADLDGAEQDSGAWASAYAAGPSAPPVQHAVLGLSAHINADLVQGIHATIVELGQAGDPRMIGRYKHDHDRVNLILFAAIPEAVDVLADRHDCPLIDLARGRVTGILRFLTIGVLVRWRARVWSDVLALLGASTEPARASILRRVARRAAAYGRVLGRPLPLAHAVAA